MIIRSLKKYWFLFLISSFVITTSIVWGASLKLKVQEDEKVDIVFVAHGINKQSELTSILKEAAPEYIKEVNFYFIPLSTNQLDFNNLLISYMDIVDIFVFPENIVETKYVPYKVEIDKTTFINQCGNPVSDKFYVKESNQKTYGACLYDSENDTGVLTDYVTYYKNGTQKNDYYLFFRENSPQGGVFTNANRNASISIAKKILSL